MPAADEAKKQPTTVYYQTNTEETQIVNGSRDAPNQVTGVICTAIAFTLVYSAFYSLISLQSSIQEVKGLGNAAVSVIHAAETISCAVIPGLSLVLTRKRTILLGLSAFVVYYAANFHPTPPMVLTAATLLGLTAGSLWGIQAAFINRLAWRRSLTVDISAAGLISRYHGLFLAIFQTSHIFSHLLTTVFVHNVESNWLPATAANETNASNNCGYLHLGLEDEIEKLSQNRTQTISWLQFRLLVGSYIFVSLVGVLLFYVKVNEVDYYYRSDSEGVFMSLVNGSKAVFAHFKDGQLLKVVPLVLFIGIEQGYIFTDFTKLFVSCTLGVSHVGRVMLCFGVANSLCSILAGLLHTVVRRTIIVAFGAMFAFGSFFVMLQWRPVSDDDGMFYVLASVFGVCDAIWVTQTRSLIGTKFFRSSDSVFIFYRMIQACGFSLSTGYSYFLPVSIKIYVMLVILAISLIGFSWFEVNERNNGMMLEQSSESKRVLL